MHNFKSSIFGKIKPLNYSQLHVTRCLINLGSFCAIFCSFFCLILAFITFIVNQLFTSVLALFPFHVSWIRTPDLCVIYSEQLKSVSILLLFIQKISLFNKSQTAPPPLALFLSEYTGGASTRALTSLTHVTPAVAHSIREIHVEEREKYTWRYTRNMYSLHHLNHLNWQSIDVTQLTHVSCGCTLNQRNHERFFLYICNN